jgi:hypothetical protein
VTVELSVSADRREPRGLGAIGGALLGAAAACGLALYGLAQLLPGAWWLLAIPLIVAAFAGCTYFLAHAGFGRVRR